MKKKIILKDRLYGSFKIDEEVIIELIRSKPLQRLKKIAQFGIPDEFYHLKNYYRYEHCVGVMLLLRRLGASEEEQVAGLLHDVSHTAFSHVIDWVIGSGHVENYQDIQHKGVVASSQIARILKRHGYHPHAISDYHHFGLLERDLPDLCADRIDYSLREFPPKIAKTCLKSLTTHGGKIVFRDKEAALLFAQHYLKRQILHWGGFEAVSRYRLFANVLQYAIDKKIMRFKDFWKDDDFIITKLKSRHDAYIDYILQALRKKSLKSYSKSKEIVHKKFRYVDPELISHGKLVRLSTADLAFKQELKEARVKNSQGIAIPLLQHE